MKAYILDNRIRIGDEVICQVDEESRAWCPKDRFKADGTKGVVIGFNRYIHYVNRNSIYDYPQGKYEQNGGAIVKWEDNTTGQISAHHICPVDQTLNETRNKDKQYIDAFECKHYLEPLPETTYYEGDIVILNRDIWDTEGPNEVRILSIDYYQIGKYCNDGITPMPYYQVELSSGGSGTTSIRDTEIADIVKRGNHWKLAHGEELTFETIQEKISFYTSLGMCKQVKCEVTGNYVWTIEAAVEAIENKSVAFLKMPSGFFGARPHLQAYCIPDMPELEEEVREHFKLNEFQEMLKLKQ